MATPQNADTQNTHTHTTDAHSSIHHSLAEREREIESARAHRLNKLPKQTAVILLRYCWFCVLLLHGAFYMQLAHKILKFYELRMLSSALPHLCQCFICPFLCLHPLARCQKAATTAATSTHPTNHPNTESSLFSKIESCNEVYLVKSLPVSGCLFKI